MMKVLRALAPVAVCVAMMAGCGNKVEPAKIDGLESYTDPATNFTAQYPKNWAASKQSQLLYVVSSSEPGVADRFVQLDKPGPAGAKIEVRSIKLTDSVTVERQMAIDRRGIDDPRFFQTEQTTLGGVPATKVRFSFDAEDGKFISDKYYAVKDSMITTLEVASFGGTFDAYKATFDKIVSSLVLATPVQAKPKAVAADTANQGPEPPSQNLVKVQGNGYSMSIPDNFRMQGVKSAGTLSGTNYLGSRRDCTIQIDVLDASKQSKLEKIANDNKAAFGGGNPQSTSLGGSNAVIFNYTPMAGISRQVYLAVKDNKLYRIFVTWNKAEEATYKPIFDKCIGSFSFN